MAEVQPNAATRARKIRPSTKSTVIFALLGCVSLIVSGLYPASSPVISGIFILLVLLLSVDWLQTNRLAPITIYRKIPTGLSLNQWNEVTLQLSHPFLSTVPVEVIDQLPNSIEAEGHHFKTQLLANHTTSRSYRIRPTVRGPIALDDCHVRVPSPLGLWRLQYQIGFNNASKVYPDFSAIASYTIFATENHISQLGLRRKNRRGQGLDFHQLREYRQGDSLRQLDWKATARRQSLISKDYQDERDQNVILLIDCGRRMRSKDDELDHFDHALNASLLLSYIALRQGDSIGVLAFGEHERWIPPQKGSNKINAILNSLYDLQTSRCAPDYLAAAESLARHQQKRSLVVLITNTRDEELDEITLAMQSLAKKHVVLLANIREAALDRAMDSPITELEEALTYCGTVEFNGQRQSAQRTLRSLGLFAVDCLAKELPVELTNSYWDIKRSGSL